MKSAKGGLLRAFFWEGAILVALVSAVAVGYVARKPVLISYHRLADRSAFSGMRRYATAEGPRNRFERCASGIMITLKPWYASGTTRGARFTRST